MRVVATFKDDTGQIVSTPSSATAAVADPPPTLTLRSHSLTLPAGGSVSLGVSLRAADSDDAVSLTITGLTSYESITDALDHQVFSGSSVTLTAAEVSRGLTLKSSYTGTDHPVNTLGLTVSNTTNGETVTSATQSISVTDPPSISQGFQLYDSNGTVGESSSAPAETISVNDPLAVSSRKGLANNDLLWSSEQKTPIWTGNLHDEILTALHDALVSTNNDTPLLYDSHSALFNQAMASFGTNDLSTAHDSLLASQGGLHELATNDTHTLALARAPSSADTILAAPHHG
jgi:hypothetical protein